MFICTIAGDERNLRVRYLPVAAWGFALLTALAVADIARRIFNGRIVDLDGPLLAMAALSAFALFVLYSGGQLVSIAFDRAADRVQLNHYGLRSFAAERRLSDITSIEVRLLRRAQHRIELRFSSGERLPITPYYIISITNRGLKRMSASLNMEPKIITPPSRIMR
jgi:hypothetical protein